MSAFDLVITRTNILDSRSGCSVFERTKTDCSSFKNLSQKKQFTRNVFDITGKGKNLDLFSLRVTF